MLDQEGLGDGVKAARPVVSSGKVASASISQRLVLRLSCSQLSKGSAASPIGFLSTQREQM